MLGNILPKNAYSILFCLILSVPATEAVAQSAAERILSVEGDVYGNEWSAPVREILLSAFDGNESGYLDTTSEINAITCEVWEALNEAVGSDVMAIYGFDSEFIWVGDALGFDDRYRRAAFDAGTACIEGWLPPADVARIVNEIAALDDPSSVPWKNKVGGILVRNYDEDGSGLLDIADEVYSIDCRIWNEIETGYAQGRYTRFWIGYGIKTEEYLTWNAESLGLSEAVRAAAWRAIQECIDVDNVAPRGVEGIELGGEVEDRIRSLTNGGSFEWKSAVGEILVDAYDVNRSGTIDTSGEIASIACEAWQAIDTGYREGEYEEFWIGYGISTAAHLTWNAAALNLTEAMRADTWAAVQRCVPAANE